MGLVAAGRAPGLPVFDNLRRWKGAECKRVPVALVTGGAGMERSGTGLNWRSQAPSPAEVSLEADSGDSSAVVGDAARRGGGGGDGLGAFQSRLISSSLPPLPHGNGNYCMAPQGWLKIILVKAKAQTRLAVAKSFAGLGHDGRDLKTIGLAAGF